MASNVVVIDKFFNRATIKVTPGTYMSEVVSEACKKLGKKNTNYDLKRSNDKPIDLSQTYRQTGLTTGAKLTLVEASRSPAPVSIALQLPQDLASAVPGGRLKDTFPSNTTLWLILRKFESSNASANLNFTGRGVAQLQNGTSGAGRMIYEMPVLNVMGREMATFGDLQKTLANLGLNKGTGLLRLTFRPTDQPIEEAMKDIGEYFKEEENVPEPTAETPQQGESVTDGIANLPSPDQKNEDVNMDSDPSDTTPYSTPTPAGASTNITPSIPPTSSTNSSTSPPILGPDGLPLTIFSAPSNDTPLAALSPHNEDDYIPTIRHAKLVQSRLQSSSQNTKLLSYDEELALETERLARLSKIKEIPLRIRFPDQMAVSKSINNEHHGKWLYGYVRGLIVYENEPFKLIYQGNKGRETIPNDDTKSLIRDLGIQGPTVINLAWDGGANVEALKGKPVLKDIYREKATQQPVPIVESTEDGEEEKKVEVKKDDESGGGEKKKRGLQNLIMKNLKKR
ncbi:dcb656cb-9f52-40fc-88f6-262fce2ca722 [Sclerotinia trifoliorum]|uniref:Dcb656cb-9f52-40fc-88f6-262fce2ca722 n=1 Tax=Sclerotinia trifoliorum TaxID=28548 RepID=A0A8H2VMX1_9HELO|nr:dcb656cb-9f52-40fc-88f6-262fce2ca722 [Sclerotinia trifoliorum]